MRTDQQEGEGMNEDEPKRRGTAGMKKKVVRMLAVALVVAAASGSFILMAWLLEKGSGSAANGTGTANAAGTENETADAAGTENGTADATGTASQENGEFSLNDGILYRVYGGDFPEYYKTVGAVISGHPEIYLEEIELRKAEESEFELLIPKGSNFDAGAALYRLDGDEYLAKHPGRVVAVQRNQAEGQETVRIQTLNFDRLYITARVPRRRLAELNYETPVNVQIKGKQYPAGIKDIGYEVSGGTVEIAVSFSAKALPGTDAELYFITKSRAFETVLPLAALYQKGEDWYADVIQNNKLIPKKVTLGEHFPDADIGIELVEITDGLSVGERVFKRNESPDYSGVLAD